MGAYQNTRERYMEKEGIDFKEYNRRVFLASQWHNPMNHSNGEDIKELYGWDKLFTDYTKKNRFYFRFHDYDLTNVDKTIKLFYKCDNFRGYAHIWNLRAPEEISSVLLYILMLTEITTKGFEHERRVLDKYRAQGCDVILSSPDEDLRGIDAWIDGRPIQIKSPRTLAGYKKY